MALTSKQLDIYEKIKKEVGKQGKTTYHGLAGDVLRVTVEMRGAMRYDSKIMDILKKNGLKKLRHWKMSGATSPFMYDGTDK